ncbi:MAG: hypothetical protein QG602_1317 [Verrucomicrobiota bacterium]|nr:hypothetical protein [Verrucomicrobiota bacterium]
MILRANSATVPPGAVLFFVFLAFFVANACVSPPSDFPADVIQRQLDAYNAKDIAALVAIYADGAELYEFPSTLLAKGSAALRERFAARFQEPNLHAVLLHRIVAGEIVIDHERVARTFPEGPGTLELTMIYEVKAGRIARAWTLPGPKARMS